MAVRRSRKIGIKDSSPQRTRLPIMAFMSWKNIADDILSEREAIIKKWLESDQGEALLRLERAYASLTGEAPPSIAQIASRLDRTRGVTAEVVDVWVPGEDSEPRSVKEAVEDLVLSDPSSVWSIGTIYKHLSQDADAFGVKDLRASIRSALYHMDHNEGIIEKVGKGEYQIVSQNSPPADTSQVSGDDGEREREGDTSSPSLHLAESQSVR